MEGTRRLSVFDALDGAMVWTRIVLFDHFDFKKWLVLGFCAFLANLGEGGGGGFNPGGTGSWRDGGEQWGAFRDWILENLTLIIALAVGIGCVALVLGILFQWIGSRGKFVFLDGVVRDRAAVAEPWGRFAPLGNSLFLFRFVLGLIAVAVFAIIILVCWMIARPSISEQTFHGHPIAALVLLIGLIIPVAFVFIMVSLLLNDFVVPAMYRRDVRVMQGWGLFWGEIVSGHAGAVIIFYLVKLALGIGAGLLIFVGTLLTCCFCCTALVPILGSYVVAVAFLPIWVFFRCLPLFLLQQMGGDWQFFQAERPAPAPSEVPPEPQPPEGPPPEVPPEAPEADPPPLPPQADPPQEP